MTTICGACEYEWPTHTGLQVCPKCGNDGSIEGHVVRENEHDENPCKSKRFATEDAAKRCLWAMQQNGRGKDLIVVRCRACGGWHFRRK